MFGGKRKEAGSFDPLTAMPESMGQHFRVFYTEGRIPKVSRLSLTEEQAKKAAESVKRNLKPKGFRGLLTRINVRVEKDIF